MKGLITFDETLTGYYSQRLRKHKNPWQLATQMVACVSQQNIPTITQGLLLSFVECSQRYPTTQQHHHPCREHREVPLICLCLLSLPLSPILLHYLLQIMAMWGKQN